MNIRIDRADKVFSQFIRKRDSRCVRCHSPVRFNDKGDPVSHTNSHYYGRIMESVRFDPENCDTLCMGCHQIWGSNDREAYHDFKVNQLGQRGFDLLRVRANTYAKRDRAMSYMVAKELLKEVYEKIRS